MFKTILNRGDTHTKSLKSTVPAKLVESLKLHKGSFISWEPITILGNEQILIGENQLEIGNGDGKKPKSKSKKIEQAILVRVLKVPDKKIQNTEKKDIAEEN